MKSYFDLLPTRAKVIYDAFGVPLSNEQTDSTLRKIAQVQEQLNFNLMELAELGKGLFEIKEDYYQASRIEVVEAMHNISTMWQHIEKQVTFERSNPVFISFTKGDLSGKVPGCHILVLLTVTSSRKAYVAHYLRFPHGLFLMS